MKQEKILLASLTQQMKFKVSLVDLISKKYQESLVIKRAVERNFEIIGEALNRIKFKDSEILENISEHYRIIGFRNILIHGYDIVDDAIVWKAVTIHLPILIKEIKGLL